VILPVLFTLFLGMIFGGAELNTFPLAVADADGSPVSAQFLEQLAESPLLKLRDFEEADVDKAVQRQKVAAGLIIPQGFGVDIADGRPAQLTLVSIETSTGSQSISQAVEAAAARLNAGLLAGRIAVEQVSAATGDPADGSLLAQARSIADQQLADPPVTVGVVDVGTSTSVAAQGFDQSSTGGLVNWVLFGIMGVAATTVWERRRGHLRRLEVAGIGASSIVGGKMLAMVIITFLQQLLLVIVGQFALGVDYLNSPGALILTMVSLSALAATVGLLISVLFRSEQAVIATTVISAQLLAAMGGAWFPLEITSAGFSWIAHILPSAWVMDSLHGIILRDWGVGDVLLPLGIVWAWVIALFALAVWRYRPE